MLLNFRHIAHGTSAIIQANIHLATENMLAGNA